VYEDVITVQEIQKKKKEKKKLSKMKELNEYRILETSSLDNEKMNHLHKSEEQS
jgi:hypothetical protein